MNNKNLIIGSLLAIVLVMTVAFAAFSTQLSITSSATTTANAWCVGFDKTKTSTTSGVVATVTGKNAANTTMSTAPTGTVAYSGTACGTNYQPTATLTTTLNQPGDSVTFTLTIKNNGSLKAALAAPTLSGTGLTGSGLTRTKGNIKFTVTAPATTLATAATTTMTVKAEFVNNTISSYTSTETATLNVTVVATQTT
ncbi:MAG: hypothetical protein IJ093_02350 [Bacilli bacterium]|nr:hypothetical protein [Bacilli bacterium]